MDLLVIPAIFLASWVGYFLIVKLPEMVTETNKSKLLREQEKTKQAEAHAAAAASNLETKRLENRQHNSYEQ